MKIIYRIIPKVFLLVFILGSYAQNREIDSLEHIAEKSKGDEKAKILLDIAYIYLINQDSLSFVYSDKAYEASETSVMKAQILYYKSFAYSNIGNDIAHIDLLKKSLAEFRQSNDTMAVEVLKVLSATYRRKGMYAEALQTGFEGLDYQKKFGNQEMVLGYQDIGYTYDRMGEYKTAIEWYEKAILIAQQLNDDRLLGMNYGLIGIAYDELEEYDKALENNFKAVEYFKNVEDKGYLKAWYSNIGNTYTKLNDYKNAEIYTLKALSIDVETEAGMVTLVNLGKIYLETNRYNEAQKVLDSALVVIQKADNRRFLSEVYYTLHELRKKQNNYKEALSFYEKYKENEDFLMNEAKANQINEMSVQYKVSEKENQILEQRAEIAEGNLKVEQKNFQIILIGGLLMLSVLLGYFFFYRQRQKAKRLEKENQLKDALAEIETQNQLQRQRMKISRELHDNIGSQLTFITSSLENIKYYFKERNEEVNKKIDNIGRFTRQTIIELRDTIWAMNKGEIAFLDLEERLMDFISNASDSVSGITFEFKVDETLKGSNHSFTSLEGVNLYRVVQEAVSNAVKHSEADRIEVSVNPLNTKEHQFDIAISDNGKGFLFAERSSGNGLANMKKRVGEIGGKIFFDSDKAGSTVRITL